MQSRIPGGYEAFVAQRAERRLSQERAFEKQRKVIADEEDYIRRNIAGQNTKQAKGRRKRLEQNATSERPDFRRRKLRWGSGSTCPSEAAIRSLSRAM